MSKQYLLPCSCGNQIVVEPTQAGETLSCSCGQQLVAPTLRQMRTLAPAQPTSAQRPSRAAHPAPRGRFRGLGFGISFLVLILALGIAASMGSGILEANRNGGSVKRVHCGWAAHAGVTAAQFARQGITAPDTVLEGRFGFFQAFTGLHPIDEGFMAGLGEEWELDKCFIKPYPTNVFTHTGIDAAMLLSKRGIDIDSIERIDLSVPMSVTRTIAEPREAKLRPQSPYHAQFSGPLTFAMAWRGGSGLGLYLDDFTQEALDDPFVRTLSEKVHYVRDEEVESLYPERLPTIARVHMADGSVIEERVMANLGTALRPIQPEQVQLKFDLNVRALGEQRAGALRDAITGLDGAASVRSVFSGLDFAESNSAA